MWWNIAEGDDPSEAGKEVKSDKKLLSSLLLENDHTMADFTGSLAMFLSGPSLMTAWPCRWLTPVFETWFIT